LGLGAGQALVTVVALIVILALIALRSLVRQAPDQPNLYLTVTSPSPGKLSASQILGVFSAAGISASLKRFDETPELLEASFLVDFQQVSRLEQFNQGLRALSQGVKISCLEDRGLGA
jgi:hypothetical protein